MGSQPTVIRIDSAATGNSADGQIVRNAVDDAFGAMSGKLLTLLRADKITPGVSAIVDSLGNSATQQSGSSKNSSDSNFNSHPSITLGATQTVPYAYTAGGIGNPSAGSVLTTSFTFVTGIHVPSGGLVALYSDAATTDDSVNTTGFYLTASGFLDGNIGGSTLLSSAALLAPGNTGVLWVSFDASTKILRTGVNSATIVYQTTLAHTRTSASGVSPKPLSYETGDTGTLSWHRFALFNKAYLNGSVPSDDAQFAALLQIYASYI